MTSETVNFVVKYHEAAVKDLKKLDSYVAKRVIQKINEVAENPLPINEGGKGLPLGNKMGLDLSNLLKIKLRGLGLRAVYKLERTENAMIIVVVGVRRDEEVYKEALKRIKKD